MFKTIFVTLFSSVLSISAAQAAVTTTYTTRGGFEAVMSSLTVIDTSENTGKTTAQLSIETPGATFFGPSSFVRNDGLIVNGAGFYPNNPHVGLNFDNPVFGVGATANAFDGGRIQIFSGLNGSGDLLGEAAYGNPNGTMFGAITSNMAIRSAVFTCDFNSDLKCGLIDPQFGLTSAVPLPAAAPLMAGALAGFGALRLRRRKTA